MCSWWPYPEFFEKYCAGSDCLSRCEVSPILRRTPLLTETHIAPGPISGPRAPHHVLSKPAIISQLHHGQTRPSFSPNLYQMELHGSQCHYFSFNIQHSKLLIIFESSVSSLNNCLQSSFSKSDMNVAIWILCKGCYEKYLRWCSIRYSPSTWKLHDEHSTTVLDVESRIKLQKTTRVNDIGKTEGAGLELPWAYQHGQMESQNANKCCFPS
jgi:hypothetical protein